MKCENCTRQLKDYEVKVLKSNAIKYGLTFKEISKLCQSCNRDAESCSLYGLGEDLQSFEGWE